MTKVALFILILLGLACNNTHEEVATFSAAESTTFKTIHLKKVYSVQSMEVLNNTMNDTCEIGLIKIAPNKTGKVYNVDFFDSVLHYNFKRYKASVGELKIKHVFY